MFGGGSRFNFQFASHVVPLWDVHNQIRDELCAYRLSGINSCVLSTAPFLLDVAAIEQVNSVSKGLL